MALSQKQTPVQPLCNLSIFLFSTNFEISTSFESANETLIKSFNIFMIMRNAHLKVRVKFTPFITPLNNTPFNFHHSTWIHL